MGPTSPVQESNPSPQNGGPPKTKEDDDKTTSKPAAIAILPSPPYSASRKFFRLWIEVSFSPSSFKPRLLPTTHGGRPNHIFLVVLNL